LVVGEGEKTITGVAKVGRVEGRTSLSISRLLWKWGREKMITGVAKVGRREDLFQLDEGTCG